MDQSTVVNAKCNGEQLRGFEVMYEIYRSSWNESLPDEQEDHDPDKIRAYSWVAQRYQNLSYESGSSKVIIREV